MAQVTNQVELQQALSLNDPLIEILNDFTISNQININYSVTIKSLTASSIQTLKRQSGYTGYLFAIFSNTLVLQDLIIDGDRVNTPNARSVIATLAGLTLNNAIIQNNVSTENGGAILTFPFSTCTLQNGSILRFCESQAVGGGIFVDGNVIASFSDSSIISNSANDGGGIYANGSFTCNSTNIINNSVTGNGGGIFANTNVTIDFTLGSISDNVGSFGAGIFLNGAQVNCIDSFISRNNASVRGGGVYLNPASVGTLTNTLVDENISQSDGGGIYVNNEGSLVFNGNEIRDNISGGVGGGIFTNGSATTMNAIISGNSASDGGGINLNGNGHLDLTVSEVTGNTATNNGGGIFVNFNTLTLENILFSDNNAQNGAAIYLNGDSQFFYNNGTISGNHSSDSGGGIFISSGSIAEITESTITGNSAVSSGGLFIGGGSATMTNSILSSNTAIYGAGAIVQDAGTLNYDGGMINNNTASNVGGALFIKTNALVIVMNTPIFENVAVRGAGVYAVSEGKFIYTNGTISRNAAQLEGGGICLDDDGEAHLSAPVLIYDNTAVNAPGIYNGGILGLSGPVNIPNGVYLESEEHQILVESSVAGAIIQLDESPYVSPNSEASPINVAEATPSYPVLSGDDEASFRKPISDFQNWVIQLSQDNTHIQLVKLAEYNIYYKNLMGAMNPNPDSYSANSLPLILQAPSQIAGCQFIGWFNNLKGGTQITVIPVNTEGDITLYARFRCIPIPGIYCRPCCHCKCKNQCCLRKR